MGDSVYVKSASGAQGELNDGKSSGGVEFTTAKEAAQEAFSRCLAEQASIMEKTGSTAYSQAVGLCKAASGDSRVVEDGKLVFDKQPIYPDGYSTSVNEANPMGGGGGGGGGGHRQSGGQGEVAKRHGHGHGRVHGHIYVGPEASKEIKDKGVDVPVFPREH